VAERGGLHRERVVAGAPIVLGPVSIVAVERRVLACGWRNGRGWLSASREPVALIVRDAAGGMHAIGIGTAATPSLDEWRARLPGLDAAFTTTGSPPVSPAAPASP
jgi:hypothetical protein